MHYEGASVHSHVTGLAEKKTEDVRARVYHSLNFERGDAVSWTFEDYNPDWDILDYWSESHGLSLQHTSDPHGYTKAVQ